MPSGLLVATIVVIFLLVATYDVLQKKHAVLRNFPVAQQSKSKEFLLLNRRDVHGHVCQTILNVFHRRKPVFWNVLPSGKGNM